MDLLTKLAQNPLAEIFGVYGEAASGSGGGVGAAEVVFAITLSFLLTAFIGAIYRIVHQGLGYSQDYVHNVILLGMVVTVIIMVVSTRVETAFAVFAAFSVIRFRRAVPQAIDVGFIFFAMAVGMAVGAQQYPLAVATTLVVSIGMLLVWRFNLFAPERPSHDLRIRVTPDIDYESAFAETFERYFDRVSLISVESVQAGLMTELKYAVRLTEGASTQDLVTEIQRQNGNNRVVMRTLGSKLGKR